MLKKLNTTWLIIILLVIGGIVLFNKFYLGKKDESTFRPVFVQIDTAVVNSISIYPKVEKGKEMKLLKNKNLWELKYDQVESDADTAAIRRLLGQFVEIKPLSLAGQDRESWGTLQVTDTSGTRIKFTTTGNKSYDMVVGKFSYNPSNRSGMTYIRYANEDAVYAIPGFLSFTVNQQFAGWKSKTPMRRDSTGADGK